MASAQVACTRQMLAAAGSRALRRSLHCQTAAMPLSAASPSAQMSRERTPELPGVGLKEWAVAIEALHRGDQTILLRKGGIKEPIFKPPGRQFILFPTSFHSEGNLLKPGLSSLPWYQQQLALDPRQESHLALTTFVEVTGAWVTEDPNVLQALDDLHIWTQEFVEARLKWRARQPLTLLELRAWRLKPHVPLQLKEEFFGCFSFVDLASGLSIANKHVDLEPALSDVDFLARQQLLRERLTGIEHFPFHLQCHAAIESIK